MSEWSFIAIDQSSLSHLYTLHEAVYNKPARPGYYHEKYDTAYTGAQPVGYIALQNDCPAACCSAIPYRVSVQGKTILAAQLCDGMTHPAHRHKGLFLQVINRIVAMTREQGIHFLFGFPNQNSYPAFIKHLDFTHAQTMNRYTFTFGDSLYKKIYRRLISSVPGQATITNPLLQEGYDGLIYDADLIKYRRYNMNCIRQINEAAVWMNRSGDRIIGAVSIAASLDDLLRYLKKKEKAASATFIISSGAQLDGALSSRTRPQPGFEVITKNLSGRYQLDKLKFQFADLDIF